MGKLSDNVLRQSAKETKLLCGHTTTGAPVVIFPNHRKMFDCPQGCGLVKSKR